MNREAQPTTSTSHFLYLGLGSNLGRRRRNLGLAVAGLDSMTGCRVHRISSLYETEPEGTGSNWYLNLVLQMETEHTPEELLVHILALEKAIGRNRSLSWPDRTVDIDILLWQNYVLRKKHLIIPHPRLHKRRFVLVPLAELAPEVIHPVLDVSVTEMLQAAPLSQVRPVGTLEGWISRA